MSNMGTKSLFVDYNPSNICCGYKKNLLIGNNLFDTVDINPKFIIFQEKFANHCPEIAKHEIHIKNTFYFLRTFKVDSNFPPYLTYKIDGSVNVVPDLEFTIEIYLNFTLMKKLKTLERHAIFLISEHPMVTIEIPVFVLVCQVPDVKLSIPFKIRMADTAPKVMCYHSFQIYNPYPEPVIFTLKQIREEINEYFKFSAECICVQPKKTAVIYMKAFSDNYCPIRAELVVRAKNIKMKIFVEMYIQAYKLYLHKNFISFSEILIGTKSESELQICNESGETVKFKWCRYSTVDQSRLNSKLEVLHNEDVNTNEGKQINESFSISPQSGLLAPDTTLKSIVYFHPQLELPPEQQTNKQEHVSTHLYESTAYLAVDSDPFERLPLKLIGTSKGPNIQFVKSDFELDCINVGERLFKEITVKNMSKVPGTITYCDFSSMINANLCITPKELTLEPKEPKVFVMSYFTRGVGKFLDKITFQIQNGEKRHVILRGTSCRIQVKLCDSNVEFGNVPICLIQKRTLLIANPLSVPASIELFFDDDGVEKPLMFDLKVQEKTSVLKCERKPLNLNKTDIFKDPRTYCDSFSTISSFWIYESNLDLVEKKTVDRQISSGSVIYGIDGVWSVCSIVSALSNCELFTDFESDNAFKDNISNIATRLLNECRTEKLVEKSDGDLEILEKIISEFKPYYKGKFIQNWKCFETMIWELNTNPKEFVIENNKIYLRPNESKNVEINLIPNVPGSFKRRLNIYCIPVQLEYKEKFCYIDHTGPKIDPNLMRTKIDCYYNCLLPDIKINNPIIVFQKVYVEYQQLFQLYIQNLSPNAGFVHFTLIPETEIGNVTLNPSKFFIAGRETKTINGHVMFSKVGPKLVLPGLVVVLGSVRPISFKLKARVLPPEIQVTPLTVKVKEKVRNKRIITVIIENISISKARVSFELKKPMKFIEVEPLGGILAPKQSLLVTLTVRFLDFGTYKNTLLINLVHFGTISVPLLFTIEELPIFFKPNIRDGLDFGKKFTSESTVEIPVEIYNAGENPYKLTMYVFSKIRCKNIPIIFEISPNILTIQPGKQQYIKLLISGKVVGKVSENLAIEGLTVSAERVKWFTSTLSIELIKPFCKWSKNSIILTSDKCEEPQNRILSDMVTLSNMTSLSSLIELNVKGDFVLAGDDKIYFKKKAFTLKPLDSTELRVIFVEKFISGTRCYEAEYKGAVITTANDYKQKTLNIRATLEFPTLRILTREQNYFTRYISFFAKSYIENCGKLIGDYKWKIISDIISKINYIETKKMNAMKNISQYILSKPIVNILISPVDVEDEYDKSVQSTIKFNDKMEELLYEEEQLVLVREALKAARKSSKRGEGDDNTNSQDKVVKKKEKKGVKYIDQVDPATIQELRKKSSKIGDQNSLYSMQIDVDNIAMHVEVTPEDIIGELMKFFPLTGQEPLETWPILEHESEYAAYFDKFKSIDDDVESPRGIILDRYQGSLKSLEKLSLNLFYEHIEQDIKLETTYQLDVFGGDSCSLKVTVYDINSKMEISPTLFDLGIQPWYKKQLINVNINNPNNIDLLTQIHLKESKFWNGNLKIKKPHCFLFPGLEDKELKIEALLGFSKYFKRDIAIEINQSVPYCIKFHGEGKMPMLSILNLQRPKLNEINQIIAYQVLNRMYKGEIENRIIPYRQPTEAEILKFQEFIEQSDEFVERNKSLRESQRKQSSFKQTSQIINSVLNEEEEEIEEEEFLEPEFHFSVSSKDGSIFLLPFKKPMFRSEVMKLYDPDLNDYGVLDYPDIYPDHLDIEHEIEKAVYLNIMQQSPEINEQYTKILKKCLVEADHYKSLSPKYFVVHPINHYVTEYEFNFGQIFLGVDNIRVLNMVFHGPGSVILSVRSEDRLMGFNIFFSTENVGYYQDESGKIKSYTYNSPHKLGPPPNPWYNYRNRVERRANILPDKCEECYDCREFCGNCQIKLCHAHSYDFDLHLRHRRGIEDIRRFQKQIHEYYATLNRSSFMSHKDPWVIAEFYPQVELCNTEKMAIELTMIFHPDVNYYSDGKDFDEYIFIDIHLGPTIPIHLTGKIQTFQTSTEPTLSNEELGPFENKFSFDLKTRPEK